MIEYNEEFIFCLLFKYRGSVAPRAALFAVPSAIVAFLLILFDDFKEGYREDLGLMELNNSQLWTASIAVLGIMLGFRTNRAMSRFWEGTGLLHQMRGEWFDSVSCCVTFSRAAQAAKPREVKVFRHTIVRLMSLCHGSALEEIAGDDSDCLSTIDPQGLNNQTLRHLNDCKEKHDFNSVEVLLHLIQSLITKGLDDGVLKIPPPILSRVYQTLSRGFVNLLNAKKITDTRFPFPYAQLITFLLLLHVVLTPMLLTCIIKSKVWAPLFTFVPIFAMFCVNFVAVELENPFGDDENDLPLDHFQTEMNTCLMMLLQENADLVASIHDKRCEFNFDRLHARMKEGQHHYGTEKSDQLKKNKWKKKMGDMINTVDQEEEQIRQDAEIAKEAKEAQEAQESKFLALESKSKKPPALSQSYPGSGSAASPLPVVASEPLVPSKPTPVELPPPVEPRKLPEAAAGTAGAKPAEQAAALPEPALEPGLEPEPHRVALVGSSESTPQFQIGQVILAPPEARTQKSMANFNEAITHWTDMIENQLSELGRNVVALKSFSDAVPALLDSARPPGSKLSASSPTTPGKMLWM